MSDDAETFRLYSTHTDGGEPRSSFAVFRNTSDDAALTTKVDTLAKRLGVDPEPKGGRGDGQLRYVISVNNGERSYNLLDLAHALLDRIDAASK